MGLCSVLCWVLLTEGFWYSCIGQLIIYYVETFYYLKILHTFLFVLTCFVFLTFYSMSHTNSLFFSRSSAVCSKWQMLQCCAAGCWYCVWRTEKSKNLHWVRKPRWLKCHPWLFCSYILCVAYFSAFPGFSCSTICWKRNITRHCY